MYPSTPSKDESGALTLEEFTDYFQEIHDQPFWRARADREMDYYDGNQLDNDILRKQAALGMPPAIEQLIAPAIDAVLGLEAKNRGDWRVTPDNDATGDDLAKAAGYKLNQAERKSKADRACSAAYLPQIGVGVGWVEVSRQTDPFRYPYRCQAVHRNEIWWDMKAVEPDLSDARYLIRRRWTPRAQVKLSFPKYAELIDRACGGWYGYDPASSLDQGDTGLAQSFSDTRGSTIEEQEWNDSTSKRVCLFEVWYRRWVRVKILRMPDGRIVEYDKNDPKHIIALVAKLVPIEEAIVAKMRQAIFMGPHRLLDRATPYRHQKFPYVPFWGKKEDRTGVPYGLIRSMMFPQDNVNATTSKLRWGLAATRVERTEDAVAMTDSQFRREVARPDADIKLKPEAMKNGGIFKVERDFQLSDQQWKLLDDSRNSINRVSGIRPGLGDGRTGASSGLQEATQVEQGTQMLADLNDNFSFARAEVGDLLLSLIVEDMIDKPETVKVPGMGLRDDLNVPVNQPVVDPTAGIQYLDNDIERAMLKVAVNDVPSTSSYRAQQLSSMSEAFKSMPPEFQRVTMPYLVALMDLPTDTAEDIIKAVREAAQAPTSDQIEKQIADAVAQARMKDMRDLKLHELMARFPEGAEQAKADLDRAKTFKTNAEALYASYQTAATSAMDPRLAPVADAVAAAGGYRPTAPAGVDPNIIAVGALQGATAGLPPEGLGVPAQDRQRTNTSPMLPPTVPPMATAGQGELAGSETRRTSDNLPA